MTFTSAFRTQLAVALCVAVLAGCGAGTDDSAGAADRATSPVRTQGGAPTIAEGLEPAPAPSRRPTADPSINDSGTAAAAPEAPTAREAPSAAPTSSVAPTPPATPTPDVSTPPDASTSPRIDGGVQAVVLRRLPGRAGPGCVVVGNRRDVRAGEFAAGNFRLARDRFAEQGPGSKVRLYWVPREASQLGPLQLQLRRVSGTPMPITLRQNAVADTGRWLFYDTRLEIPAAGTWEIVATSGELRGCFIVRFGGASR